MPLICDPHRPSLLPQPVTPSERLRVLGEGRLLQIQPTQVSDSGRYLCVAANVAGEDDQDFNVIIQGAWGPWNWGWRGGRRGASELLGQAGRRTLLPAARALSQLRLAALAPWPGLFH